MAHTEEQGCSIQEDYRVAAGALAPLVGQDLAKFAEEYIPSPMHPDAIRHLQSLLERAQKVSPPDRGQFVDTVNRILDIYGLRISTEPDVVGKLHLNQDGYIQIARQSGGLRGFKRSPINLIKVPDPADRCRPVRASKARSVFSSQATI